MLCSMKKKTERKQFSTNKNKFRANFPLHYQKSFKTIYSPNEMKAEKVCHILFSKAGLPLKKIYFSIHFYLL